LVIVGGKKNRKVSLESLVNYSHEETAKNVNALGIVASEHKESVDLIKIFTFVLIDALESHLFSARTINFCGTKANSFCFRKMHSLPNDSRVCFYPQASPGHAFMSHRLSLGMRPPTQIV
jgi:hypothetical protein